MLGVIFFSLAFGVALAFLPPDRTKALVEALRGLGDVMIVIIDLVMKLAPYGVFALLFTVTARFGLDLLERLGWYILTVVAGLAVFEFGVYPVLIKVFTGWSPWNFFRRAWTAILTAFSTSSSNATLPTTLEVCEDSLGLPREVCGFVVPLGATMCMNGTALFEGVTVLFIAQVFGIHLSLSSQIVVMVTAILMSMGAAGVPSGGIQVLILVLEAVGVPGEGIAMVVGVDRVLDMCRTVVNVTGDMVTATFVARSEGNAGAIGSRLLTASREERRPARLSRGFQFPWNISSPGDGATGCGLRGQFEPIRRTTPAAGLPAPGRGRGCDCSPDLNLQGDGAAGFDVALAAGHAAAQAELLDGYFVMCSGLGGPLHSADGAASRAHSAAGAAKG